MFSFFKSKKHSPDTPPEDVPPIPPSDEYVFVDKKDDPQPSPGYPSGPYPRLLPFQTNNKSFPDPNSPPSVVNFIQGMPFKLSPDLVDSGNSTEITRLQVDEILSSITRLENYTTVNYDFNLEREIISQ